MDEDEKKDLANKLLDLYLPIVDYNEDDVLTQREVMLKNAKEACYIALDLVINYGNELEKMESGVSNGYWFGQNDYKDVKEIIRLTEL
jgi:hypothetical protein